MNYPYARGRRIARRPKSMEGAGNDWDPRRFKNIPRAWSSDDRSIDTQRALRRERRNAVDKAIGQPPLFSTVLERVKSGFFKRGLARSIARYSSVLVFSKAARIRAGKR